MEGEREGGREGGRMEEREGGERIRVRGGGGKGEHNFIYITHIPTVTSYYSTPRGS